jgi:hypothetical protein
MPIYRFHIASDGSRISDPHGIELPDTEAANRHARQLAQGLATITGPRSSFVEITDKHGVLIARIQIPINGR